METTAIKIRRLREVTKLSRREFAEHIGIPLRTIEDWESGRRNPPEYVIELIEFRITHEKP